MAPRSSKILDDPMPVGLRPNLSLVKPPEEQTGNSDTHVSFEDGAMKIDHPDGSVTIDFEPQNESALDQGFNENLARSMPPADLEAIASELLEGVANDEQSRKEWMDMRALGISLLGLKIEQPRTDAGASSAPLEGMSSIRHPLLMEATISFQATARAELLPASGPVKVRNDSPPPPNVNKETSATAQLSDSLQSLDELGQALEKDMNHYLTSIATEYIPDTDRMLFYVGFGGDGFKKVYNCPLRRRPVSESVDAEDLIISNHCTDLYNSNRITHRIKMKKSTLRRMQIIGAYLDVDLQQPSPPVKTPVDTKKEEIAGVRTNVKKPEDLDHEIYEIYCELDLDQFAPKRFKGKSLPLPYRVTIEKDSRKVLDVRRNWDEDDKECMPRRFFVQFPFIRGLGFYGLGFIHVLGNTTNALTAAWREMLDAGMFASFPGFLYSKGGGRQNTNQFRVGPGQGVGLDIGTQANIRDSVMPLPYKEPGASFTGFITHVEEVGRRLASTGSVMVGEGKQDAPVGTTLALIEQASKVIDSAHKRLHAAQAEEFKLLKCRFKEDPESFWRHNRRPTMAWKKDQFIQALSRHELVPVADPNNPTYLHRLAKGLAVLQLQQSAPDIYDKTAVHMRVMKIADIDPQGLFAAQPAAPPPDPRMEAITAKSQGQQQDAMIKMRTAEMQMADKAQERASKEKIAMMNLERENIIHAHDAQLDQQQKAHDLMIDRAKTEQELAAQQAQAVHEMRGGIIRSQQEIAMENETHRAAMQRAEEEHATKQRHAQELHEAKLAAARELAAAKVEAAKKLAAAKPKPKPKGDSK